MVKRFVPEGVMPALVTPFTKLGDFHEEGFNEVIDYAIERGATGVVPGGTTGEFVYLRTEERKKLLRLAVEFTNGRVPVVAGTGQNSTNATVSLTKYAADIGCDGALVVSPFYLRPSDKGYYEHYEAIASKADFPIILYNIPQCTLGVLSSNLVLDLAELDNIVGIKDSSGNISHTLELIQKLDGKIPVLIGHDECFLSAIAAGAEAAILASANVIPHIWLDIMKRVKNGDMDGAMKMQISVQTLTRLITRNGGAPPVKAALKMMGIQAGRSRLPLNTGGTLTPETKDEVRMELEKLGLIQPSAPKKFIKDISMEEMFDSFGLQREHIMGSKSGSGANDTVSVIVAVGSKKSPLGPAFVKLLTSARIGHEALSVILEPNLFIKPSSIMIPLRKITSMRQASFFYGPVQSGAAKAVVSYLKAGGIPKESIHENVMIMILDVDLDSRDRRAVTMATEEAVLEALAQIWGEKL